MTAASLGELDRAWLHPFTSIAEHEERPGLVPVEGRGCRVRDAEGRWYLDAMAGLWCVNAGYGRNEIADAIAAQARRLPYYHGFAGASNEPAIRLAARLRELAPMPNAQVFFASSGLESNDSQIKLIWHDNNLLGRPAKKKLIARELELAILREGPETVAAFFAEPVMGAGGVLVPPERYFERIQAVLRRHDVLLVADEVICGFGRLGRWFESQRYGIAPDLVTIAKGLTSGYLPMSACLISERIHEVLRASSREVGPFAHGYTYSGHPVAAAAALANPDILEREGLVERAERVGALLQTRLRDVRGVGLIAALEPRAPDDAKRLAGLLLADGVIARVVAGCIAVAPPMVLATDEVEELVSALTRALDALD